MRSKVRIYFDKEGVGGRKWILLRPNGEIGYRGPSWAKCLMFLQDHWNCGCLA